METFIRKQLGMGSHQVTRVEETEDGIVAHVERIRRRRFDWCLPVRQFKHFGVGLVPDGVIVTPGDVGKTPDDFDKIPDDIVDIQDDVTNFRDEICVASTSGTTSQTSLILSSPGHPFSSFGRK